MKKAIALLLALCTVLTLVGCGNKNEAAPSAAQIAEVSTSEEPADLEKQVAEGWL